MPFIVKVQLHHPARAIEVLGPRRVRDLLAELRLVPETVLVIRGDELITEDEPLREDDAIEIRPVISGGAW